jgi:hypothetical protein
MGTKRKGVVPPQEVKVSYSSRSQHQEDESQIAPNVMSERSLKPPRPHFRGLSQELATAETKSFIQPKLTIGTIGDRYEQEADRVASDVVQKIHAPQLTNQSKPIQRQDENIGKIQPKLNQNIPNRTAPTNLDSSIQSARVSGQPLADTIRQPMEQAFGTDFSGVKIHTDSIADNLSQSIQARAFTTGKNIFFKQGEYNPSSKQGQELLAHELTHVIQQSGNAVQDIQRKQMQVISSKPTLGEMTEGMPVFASPPDYITIKDKDANKQYRVKAGQSFLNIETIKKGGKSTSSSTTRKVNTNVTDSERDAGEIIEIKDGHHRFVCDVLGDSTVNIAISLNEYGSAPDSWSSMKWQKHPDPAISATPEEMAARKQKAAAMIKRMGKNRKTNENKG